MSIVISGRLLDATWGVHRDKDKAIVTGRYYPHIFCYFVKSCYRQKHQSVLLFSLPLRYIFGVLLPVIVKSNFEKVCYCVKKHSNFCPPSMCIRWIANKRDVVSRLFVAIYLIVYWHKPNSFRPWCEGRSFRVNTNEIRCSICQIANIKILSVLW